MIDWWLDNTASDGERSSPKARQYSGYGYAMKPAIFGVLMRQQH